MTTTNIVADTIEDGIQSIPRRISLCCKPYVGPTISKYIGKIDIDAPFTLTFAFLCLIVQILHSLIGQKFIINYFSIMPFKYFVWTNPGHYIRIFSQIVGHTGWEHLTGNMINLLLVGPACEREFGFKNLSKLVGYVCIASSIAHMLFANETSVQLGASGVVFMLILLNSLVSLRTGTIPLTFVLQVCLWVNKEIIAQLFVVGSGEDSVSHVAHLSGAIVGTVMGYKLHYDDIKVRARTIGTNWLQKSRQ